MFAVCDEASWAGDATDLARFWQAQAASVLSFGNGKKCHPVKVRTHGQPKKVGARGESGDSGRVGDGLESAKKESR